MHRLSGEDAGFLLMDLPGQPMNSMVLGVLEPSPSPMRVEDLRTHLAGRLDELPSWRWRIVRVPGDLHHPVAYTPGDPDLEHHVQEIVLGGQVTGTTVVGGASDTDLEALFADLAEEHLDPDLPLWRVWLVSGLAGDRQAVIMKYHHALADGTGAVTTMARVFSDAAHPPPHDAGPVRAERRPGGLRLVLGALWAHLWSLLTVLPLLLRTRRGAAAVKERREQAGVQVPPYSEGAPRTLLNAAFTPQRSYTRAELPISGIKQIKDVAGVTLNDVVLAVVAGAAVRYLAQFQPEFDPTSERPLLTTVPMAFERSGAPVRQHGNRFWSFTTSLATDVPDPWQRLRTISATAGEGKAQLDALGPDLVPDWLDRMPPLIARKGIRDAITRLEASVTDADASILVSNIRGPGQRWSIGGREFATLHCDGPPSNGVGINVMVWSYAGEMMLGILGYAGALAHPDRFRSMVEESYQELLAAARTRTEVAPADPSADDVVAEGAA